VKNVLRLNSVSPSLARSFLQADDRQRRQAALVACLIAVSSVDLHGDDIDAAIGILRSGEIDSAGMRRTLKGLSRDLDSRYLQLVAEAGYVTPEVLLMFRKARAISALVVALAPDSTQLHEAVYEAIVASPNRIEAIQSVEKALKLPAG
jgi:hypothetical protein